MELDDQYDKLGKSEIPWAQDDIPRYSTIAPEVSDLEPSSQIGTVVIFVISAILAITLLFGIALFIDCRHQKLTEMKQSSRTRKTLRLRIPKITVQQVPVREDEDTLADKMQLPESSGPDTASVIV